MRPPWTPAEFRHYVARARGEHDRPPSHLCRLVVVDGGPDDGALAGACNLNHLVWGGLRAGSLGYYAFAARAGRGYVRAGVALLLTHAFRRLGLHRVEAAVQPDNEASWRLVEALGFRHEGLSPRYLLLAGRWRDHERWALHADEWRPGPRTRSRAAGPPSRLLPPGVPEVELAGMATRGGRSRRPRHAANSSSRPRRNA